MAASEDLERLNSLVSSLYERRRYTEAIPVAVKAFELATVNADASDLITPLNNLAHLYRAEGKPEEAEKYFNRALAVCERLPHAASRMVMLLHDLARVNLDQQKYVSAEAILKRALACVRNLPSGDDLEVGQIFHDLGSIYHEQKRFLEDEECHQRALTIYEALGANAEAATVLNHLAVASKN